MTGELGSGTLYGFDVTHIAEGVVTRKWKLIGDANFSQLGVFTSIGNPITSNPGDIMYIAVSSPDRTVKNPPFEWYRGGRVTLFDFGLLRYGTYYFSQNWKFHKNFQSLILPNWEIDLTSIQCHSQLFPI